MTFSEFVCIAILCLQAAEWTRLLGVSKVNIGVHYNNAGQACQAFSPKE